MNTYKLSNIPLKDLKKYLTFKGAKCIRITGGHEIWSHPDLNRPIPIQTHIDPVPEFIVKQIIDYFNDNKKAFHDMLKTVDKKENLTDDKVKKVIKRGKRPKE
jgi:hypothetical protein